MLLSLPLFDCNLMNVTVIDAVVWRNTDGDNFKLMYQESFATEQNNYRTVRPSSMFAVKSGDVIGTKDSVMQNYDSTVLKAKYLYRKHMYINIIHNN